MGKLTLNVLLSFAQFEREVTDERIRDKIAASKRKGLWISKTGNVTGGKAFSHGALYGILQNRVYIGEISHKEVSSLGQQPAIIDSPLWERVQGMLKNNAVNREKRASKLTGTLLTR
ncbi:MAG: recombinase family protein, partial [Bryocella sp.]